MEKSLFHILIVAFCLLPTIALGDKGKCIDGDCVNGRGVYLYSNGEKYDGEFRNGAVEGDGTYTYPDGSKYIGEFANGVRHGQGILKIVKGITYIGQWANDLPNGPGVKTLADGIKYSGEFKNGLLYGSGTLVMPDNRKLTIKWSNENSSQENWYMTTTPGDTQKLFNEIPQQSTKYTKIYSQDFNIGDENPTQEYDQSAVYPEQVAPQVAKDDEVSVKDIGQSGKISKILSQEEEKIKFEPNTQVEKKDDSETKELLPQNIETTNTVEYASIAVGANIRSQASLTSEVLRAVPQGFPVIVLKKQEDWLLVEDYRGRNGWVHAPLVTKPGTVIIKVFKGNLRSGPSLKDDRIVQLEHGTIMSVLERKKEWLKVTDFKELTGWLNQKVIWPVLEKNI